MSKDVVSANKQVLGPVIFGDQQMPWSKGVVAGGFVFLSGMVGVTDLATGNAGDIEAQLLRILRRFSLCFQGGDCDVVIVVRRKAPRMCALIEARSEPRPMHLFSSMAFRRNRDMVGFDVGTVRSAFLQGGAHCRARAGVTTEVFVTPEKTAAFWKSAGYRRLSRKRW